MVKEDWDRLSVLRRELRKQLGSERYELWLGHAELAWADGVLEIRCPSEAQAVWLQRRLHETLVQCATTAFGSAPTVAYETAEIATPAHEPEGAKPQPEAAILLPTEPAVESNQKPPFGPSSGGRPRWTFDDFVCGASNRAAVQAGRDAALQPGRFSPLLIMGPAGVGKTHLLQAIAHCGKQRRVRALLLTAEQFTSQFLGALDSRSLPGFRQKMRSLDMLLVDDVHFLAGKKATLEELLYTIDALAARGGQVVLASSVPVSQWQSLSSGLASRVEGGLEVALEPPDYLTRDGIVRSMAARMNIPLEEKVIRMVAERVAGSGRLLSGAINRMVAASMALEKPITTELAGAAIDDFCRQHSPQVKLEDIQRAVCHVFGLESSTLKSGKKTRAVAEPRMLAMWLARRYTRAPLSEIGGYFGRRSHSTVVSAQRKLDQLISGRGVIALGNQACPVEEAIRRVEARLRTG